MTKKQKKILLRVILSAILFIIALLIKSDAVSLCFYLVSYLFVGYDVLWSALRKTARAQLFDEEFLMSIATLGAFAIKESPEAVAVMLFYQVGELFQSIAVGKSRRSIASLMDIRPDEATVLRGGAELTVSPDEIEVGETILVRPGEKIALDGVIIEGSTTVNASALTGESVPQDKSKGDRVISGSVNISGLIKVRTDSAFEGSTVSKILRLVEESAEKKAKTEKFITKFSRFYTPLVVVGALALAIILPIFLGEWNKWIERALVFLVVSCPCALVISVPLSFFGGIGRASRDGILIKGANYLEVLSKVKTVAFDKTGTLTKGNFKVAEVHSEKISGAELLRLCACAECYSTHPVAEAVKKAYEKEIDKNKITDTKEIPGMGVRSVFEDKTIYAGNASLMKKVGAAYKECGSAGTVVYLSQEDEYLGCIVISDEIKEGAKEAVSSLKKIGITKTVMLTGDLKSVADSVAKTLGIDQVCSELLPEEKVGAIEKLLPAASPLAFVGDGVNDAPVLSRADIGIAMGALGSDAAIEAADVVLMDDDPKKIAHAIRLSRKTMRIVKQNVAFALTVKAAILALGALGFANMWIAVFADVGVMMIAVMNSMRNLYTKR